jgi:hypothetical protein
MAFIFEPILNMETHFFYVCIKICQRVERGEHSIRFHPWWKGGQESTKTLPEVVKYLCGKRGPKCIRGAFFSGTAERNVEGVG